MEREKSRVDGVRNIKKPSGMVGFGERLYLIAAVWRWLKPLDFFTILLHFLPTKTRTKVEVKS
jgi:hypothetical protein